MTLASSLVIVPFLALLATLPSCARERADGSRGSTDPDGSELPWARDVPWAEGDGPIAAYFRTGPADGAKRARLVDQIAALEPEDASETSRDRTEAWSRRLHDAGLFRSLAPGRNGITQVIVPVGYNRARRVYVRVPKGYDPARPWPLILAYHGGGGEGRQMIASLENLLGAERDRYVIAAPNHYRQTSLDHPRPVSSEHLAVLHALRGLVHVDADRVYVTGYSLGGYTAWHLATFHADRFAGAMPMASTFGSLGGPEGVWTELFANFRHLPILSVWGGRDRLDVPNLNARGSAGSMSQLNRRLGPLLAAHDATSVDHYEVAGAGHGGARPPRNRLLALLRRERTDPPRRVEHHFRYIHQGHAYWIEGHRWLGSLWDEPWPGGAPGKARRGADDPAWQAIRERLGSIRGAVEDPGEEAGGRQRIEVETRHLADLTVWIEDGMIDWQRPVTVVHNGTEVFSGRIEPTLGVALAQARRTRDFDRLRWAGVRIDATAGTARLVTPEEELPGALIEVLP